MTAADMRQAGRDSMNDMGLGKNFNRDNSDITYYTADSGDHEKI
jgi:hypothetical protein